jgi:hypothetical protein
MAALSKRAYARHRKSKGLSGGSLQAVQRALRRGWIHALPSGLIDPVRADEAWAALHVPRVSIYLPGTRRLKSENGDRPVAKARRQGEEKSTRRVGAWEPTQAQVRRWTKCREQLRDINGRLAATLLSPHVPVVERRTNEGPYRPLRYRDVPDWAHQHPRFYALLLADEHLTDALIELSRVVGYPGYTCPEDK